MSGASRYLADGTHADVRWFVERPADMPAPMAVVTLQTWHGPGRTYVSEVHEVIAQSRGMIVRMAEALLERLEAKALANTKRASHLKAKVAVVAVLLALGLGASGASSQTVTKRSYDAHGRETGRAELRPDGSVHYFGPTGRATGRSETRSDGSVHDYDEHETVSYLGVVWARPKTAGRGKGMKWRVMVELTGSDGSICVHDVSVGG